MRNLRREESLKKENSNMNSDIEHLQNRIKNLESKIGFQSINSSATKDPSTLKVVKLKSLENSRNITINNIELEASVGENSS
jgi:hypothetical protein